MNILFTSAGRRSYLIKYFKEALGNQGEIHVANSTSHSTAMKYGDRSVVTPLIYSNEYIPFLKSYCEENRIDALISLFDMDLPVLSDHIEEFKKIGVKVIVSNKDVISICNDKWLTYNYLLKHGFNTPMTYLSFSEAIKGVKKGLVGFPFFIKPRWGMGSLAVFEAENIQELIVFAKKTKSIINSTYLSYESHQNKENCLVIQEKITGQEFGLDIINDLESNYKATIVQKKLVMRSGETDSAETIESELLAKTGARLGRTLRHIGNLDTDAFIVNGVPYILEMNARFGGGYPFSHLAGANLPKAIISWLRGEVVEKSLLEAKSGVIGYKELTIIESQLGVTTLIHS